MTYSGLTKKEISALVSTASALGVSADSLYQLIKFESGWNVNAENKITHAKGLIQFMPKTAQALGYEDQYDLVAQNPDRISQLKNPVYQYLKQFQPFKDDQSLFMAVFYPAYRYKPIDTPFPKVVQLANPNIYTPKDYIRKVWGKALPAASGAVGAVVAALLAFFLIYSYKKGRFK